MWAYAVRLKCNKNSRGVDPFIGGRFIELMVPKQGIITFHNSIWNYHQIKQLLQHSKSERNGVYA